jgi:acyl-coenzyme A synthetase/AMP-(fatty) acid ligase
MFGDWYRTGDKGYFSTSHQQYAITGRYKEIFKVRYEEVSPDEVEAELLKHPGIRDAAVTSTVARDNEKDCECVAYVVADLGVQAVEVLRWLEGKVSRHKLPTGGVMFCGEIPRNGLGKVVRGELAGIEVQERSRRYLEVDWLGVVEKQQ